jgi:hypothetical protein
MMNTVKAVGAQPDPGQQGNQGNFVRKPGIFDVAGRPEQFPAESFPQDRFGPRIRGKIVWEHESSFRNPKYSTPAYTEKE